VAKQENKMNKQMIPMSTLKGRTVKLFRSSDKTGTASYWTNLDREHKGIAEAFFEILVFDYEYGKNEVYIRYPETDYFVETTGGYNSRHGTMNKGNGINPWSEKYSAKFELYNHDKNLMFKDLEHNFLIEVASVDYGNSTFPKNPTYVNQNELEEAFALNYLKLPDDLMTIAYAYKTNDAIPTYFLIFYPTYNFGYNTHKAFSIKRGVATELTITEFQRYRDGGTTIIKVKESVDGFYFPTPWKLAEISTYNGIPIVKATDDETRDLIMIIGITIEKE
jgi:hypothetical protein